MQYYKTRYVPNNLTFIVAGDVVAKSAASSSPTCSSVIRKIAQPVFIPRNRRTWADAKRTGISPRADASLARLHIPEVTNPDVPALDLLSTILATDAVALYTAWPREAGLASAYQRSLTPRAIQVILALMLPSTRRNAKQPAIGLRIVDEVKQRGVTAKSWRKQKK
jgi:zinc protease